MEDGLLSIIKTYKTASTFALYLLTACPPIDIDIKEENKIQHQLRDIKNLEKKIGIPINFVRSESMENSPAYLVELLMKQITSSQATEHFKPIKIDSLAKVSAASAEKMKELWNMLSLKGDAWQDIDTYFKKMKGGSFQTAADVKGVGVLYSRNCFVPRRFLTGTLPTAMVLMTRLPEYFFRSSPIMMGRRGLVVRSRL
ncbi:hypothetical protein AVEN_134847-1 [Araneus ventricosus]|uniref:Uncharacterized protein n=1 Tax=Araneus ventricosus TaxID=182803 RepID=A0A4Y2TJM2_ARAVE|nr:hypothetical protein AVEN_134847-1 [Araneus ventricosus]